MEVLFIIMGIIFASTFLVEKATDFVKQIKSSGSARLSKGFEARLSVVPVDKKSEVSAPTQTSQQTIHNE